MIANRANGFRTLYSLAILVAMPLWFIFATIIAVELWDVMDYNQVNYPVYLMGIIIAYLIASINRSARPSAGPARTLWLNATAQANADMLFHTLIIFGLIYATKDKAISRQFVGVYLLSTWIFLLLAHRYLPNKLSSAVFAAHTEIPTIFIGTPLRTKKLSEWAEAQKNIGVNILGIVNVSKSEDPIDTLPVIGEISELEALIDKHHIQQIILTDTRQSKTFVQYIVEICHRLGVRILINNPWEDYIQQPMQVINDGTYNFFTFKDEPLQNPTNRILKRLLDLAVAIPVCICILPFLALAVKMAQAIQSPGPLLYKQSRTGAEKRRFTIYKFRSMHVQNNANEGKQATKADARVFPFGSFLRRTSLDEFPQFINVLVGSMSTVGPRPHLLQHDEEFSRYIEIYRSRHHAKPGITGMAQYKGFRGEINSPIEIKNRVEFDLQYIYNWSIWLDLGIIIKTFAAILFPPKSAY